MSFRSIYGRTHYYNDPEPPVEPKDTQFNDGQWANGKLACSDCNEIIPGGETYFDIPGQGIFCESCARYKFGHEAPYYYD